MMQVSQVKMFNIKKSGEISNNTYLMHAPAFFPATKYSNRFSTIKNDVFVPTFTSLHLEENTIKKVKDHKYIGQNIFTPDNYIDFSKIGSDKLSEENLDITKATDQEITAYRYSLALTESYESSWVNRYNPDNRSYMLATMHTLNSEEKNNNYYSGFIDILNDKFRCKSLDVPVFHKDGKLALNGVIFDTETTGVRTSVDKIIQIAALQLKDGKVSPNKEHIYNQLLNPEIHIPDGASAVNGITDDMVKNSPTMDGVLKPFLKGFLNKTNGIVIAYNGFFDISILNRCIREHNLTTTAPEKEKQLYKVLDPFILIQRIHPFLGVKKTLSQQYQWLFCKKMENAHDALADVRGTVDVLKYCLYYIGKHQNPAAKKEGFPITLREVLAFQFGNEGVENINIPIDETKHFRNNVIYNKSYRSLPINVDNYFKCYKLTRNIALGLKDEIGEENFKKLEEYNIINHKVDLTYKNHKIMPEETKNIPNSNKYQNTLYVMKKNMKKVLGIAELQDYNGKTKDEIEDLIIEKSKSYLHNKNVEIKMKNVNPKDIAEGNDLPDMEIARRVMRERAEEDKIFNELQKGEMLGKIINGLGDLAKMISKSK